MAIQTRLPRRIVHGLYGAVVVALQGRDRDVWQRFKDALAAGRLLSSPHTEGMTVVLAAEVIQKARLYGFDPFELWNTFDAYVCQDIEQAVAKGLELRAMYARPLSSARPGVGGPRSLQ